MDNHLPNKNEIDNVSEEIKALKKKRMSLINEVKYKSKQTYRKERARRLIETGALAEKYFELDGLTITEREEIFKMFSDFITSNKPKKYKKK